MHRMAAVALVVLCACVDEPGGSGVVGSRNDLRTTAGDYVGYRVVTTCMGSWTDVGVIGTGSVEISGQDAIVAAGQDLREQLVDITSIWGWGGYSLVCEPGVGTSVDLSDWRDVDDVIARIGEWLRTHDYRLQVGVSVDSQPVPLAN